MTGERLFSFRWDVDHHVCITDGLPGIRRVCRELGVVNTFFINMGRSTNLREWLGKGFAASKEKFEDMEAVHLIKKTGWSRFVLETVLSRPVGLSYVKALQTLQGEGHELGLHGGMDHVLWSRRFRELSEDVIAADVEASLGHFVNHFGKPSGFSAPGFKSDERLTALLDRLGFLYDGDAIGGEPHLANVDGRPSSHWTIPVTLAGPRTIPFLEYHGARGTSEREILSELDRHLQSRGIVILYGHPSYEGIHVDRLRKVFAYVAERGFRFVTHAEIEKRLSAGSLVPRGCS